MIVSPFVKWVARKHFNCPSMPGVRLENEGGKGTKGSHWDRAEMGDETMCGSSMNEQRYSIFTLAFLGDSGWYYPVWKKADRFTWGYGEGCAFGKNLCRGRQKFVEFC